MLSSVLNSPRAIRMNVQIMRIFTKMKEMLVTNKDLLLRIEEIERKISGHDHSLAALFEHLKKQLSEKQHHEEHASRTRIGFKHDRE